MTKSEGIPKSECRTCHGTSERPSTFGLRISFVIGHSSFVIGQQLHGPNACAEGKGASHEPERGQPCPRGHGCPRSSPATFVAPTHGSKAEGAFHEPGSAGIPADVLLV